MNIKKKNFIFCLVGMFIFACLLCCGIFAAVTKSVSFNLALKLDPQIYFSLSMRIDYDGDGNYTGTHPSDDQISEGTSYTIFNNSANATGLVNWATVNQNCIVLNQVLAGNILSNLTVNSRFEITVTNLTPKTNATEYLNLTLNYNGAEEVFKADNGYGAVNMEYGVASGDTSAAKTFTLIPQTTLLNGYIQIPFLAEIDTEKRYTASITTTNCGLVSAPKTFNLNDGFIAEFEAPDLYEPIFTYSVTIAGNSYTDTNYAAVLAIAPEYVLGNIVITASAVRNPQWSGAVASAFSGGNGTEAAPFEIRTGEELALVAQVVNSAHSETAYSATVALNGKTTKVNVSCDSSVTFDTAHYKVMNEIILNDETYTFDESNGLVKMTDGTNSIYIGTGVPGTQKYSTYETATAKGTFYANTEKTAGTYGGIIYSWPGIGGTTEETAFQGTFDGQNYRIAGMYRKGAGDYYGFFRCANNAHIKNVFLDNVFIYGSSFVGGVVGPLYSTNINNCKNMNGVMLVASNSGGIIGRDYTTAPVINCQNSSLVVGTAHVGGIAGFGSTILNCINLGSIYDFGEATPGSKLSCTGGVNGLFADIYNCVNYGSVKTRYNGCGSVIGYRDTIYTHENNFYLTGSAKKLCTTMNAGTIVAGYCDTTSDSNGEYCPFNGIDGTYTRTVDGESESGVVSDALNAWVAANYETILSTYGVKLHTWTNEALPQLAGEYVPAS